jgi:Cys-rich four helix bundle protein (predicted Tat secretion target)
MKSNNTKAAGSLSRRRLLQGLAAGGAAISMSKMASAQPSTDPLKMLMETALHCVRDGELCLHHIMLIAATGDNSLIECAQKITETVAICESLVTLAAHNSTHLNAVATASIDINQDCEAECRKHEAMHAECKAMAESCADCIAQCEAITA